VVSPRVFSHFSPFSPRCLSPFPTLPQTSDTVSCENHKGFPPFTVRLPPEGSTRSVTMSFCSSWVVFISSFFIRLPIFRLWSSAKLPVDGDAFSPPLLLVDLPFCVVFALRPSLARYPVSRIPDFCLLIGVHPCPPLPARFFLALSARRVSHSNGTKSYLAALRLALPSLCEHFLLLTCNFSLMRWELILLFTITRFWVREPPQADQHYTFYVQHFFFPPFWYAAAGADLGPAGLAPSFKSSFRGLPLFSLEVACELPVSSNGDSGGLNPGRDLSVAENFSLRFPRFFLSRIPSGHRLTLFPQNFSFPLFLKNSFLSFLVFWLCVVFKTLL